MYIAQRTDYIEVIYWKEQQSSILGYNRWAVNTKILQCCTCGFSFAYAGTLLYMYVTFKVFLVLYHSALYIGELVV